MIIAVVCCCISIIQLLVIHYLVKPRTFYLSVLRIFLIYPVIVLQLLPLTLEILTPGLGEKLDINLIHAYLVNFIYMTACVLLWRIYTKSYSEKYRAKAEVATRVIFLITLLSIIFNLIKVASLLQVLDIDLETQLFPFTTFFHNLFKISPFAFLYGCIIQKGETSRSLRMFVYLSVVIYFISIIPTGHRSSLIIPAILMIFYINRLGLIKKTLISLVCLVCFAQVADYYKSFRIIFSPDSYISEMEHVSTSFLEEVYFRFKVNNEISSGIAKIINESSSPAGLKPLSSALGAIIPASLYEGDKPWPGSVDGTKLGILSRIAHQEVYQAGYNMSEYMYPLHPIWELGYLYYIFNIILSVFGILAIERLSGMFGDRMFLLPISVMLPFSYSYTFMPLVILLQQFYFVFIPGFLLLVFIFFLRPLYRIKVSRDPLIHRHSSAQSNT
jgi:hypothetical protein